MIRVFVLEDEYTDDEEPIPKVRYKTILQEEDYETEDDVPGYPTRDFAPIDWESRKFVEPWDPYGSNFFRIQ